MQIKILLAGKKCNSIKNKGFTLIELMVVISLLSVMLFISLPRFQDAMFNDANKKASRWIIGQIKALKETSLREQKTYILNINLDLGEFWITNSSMTEEDSINAPSKGYTLPKDLRIIDIEFSEQKKTHGKAEISFFPQGYSTKAIIHLKDNDDMKFSFIIEPFIFNVKFYQNYYSFESS